MLRRLYFRLHGVSDDQDASCQFTCRLTMNFRSALPRRDPAVSDWIQIADHSLVFVHCTFMVSERNHVSFLQAHHHGSLACQDRELDVLGLRYYLHRSCTHRKHRRTRS